MKEDILQNKYIELKANYASLEIKFLSEKEEKELLKGQFEQYVQNTKIENQPAENTLKVNPSNGQPFYDSRLTIMKNKLEKYRKLLQNKISEIKIRNNELNDCNRKIQYFEMILNNSKYNNIKLRKENHINHSLNKELESKIDKLNHKLKMKKRSKNKYNKKKSKKSQKSQKKKKKSKKKFKEIDVN